jgi:tetratricopeptide (TPR) repeat protein
VPRWLVAAALLSTILTGTAAGQSGDPKSNFVQALGQFSLALDGTYGDEGPAILASLDALDRSVTQWDEAISAYEAEAAKNPPSDPKLAALMHVGLGGLYLDRTRIADAQRELDAAIALDSSRPDVFTLQGLARTAARDNVGAASSFRRALDLDPTGTARAYVLARTLARTGKADEARTSFRLVADNLKREAGDRLVAVSARFMRFGLVEERTGVEPFFPPASYADAFARLERGDLRQAIAQLRSAVARDILVADAVSQSYAMRKAADAFRDGDLGTAIVQLQAAIELYSNRPEPHRLLGLVYAADEQYERGIAELKIAIRLSAADERSRLALADVFVRADQVAAAEQALRETLTAIPASGRAHYVLARLYQRQGRQAEALREFEQAITFGPLLGLNGIYQTMGALHAARQTFDAAVSMYSTRVDIQPNDAGAHQDLGDTYARLGRDEEALAEFSVALLIDPERAAAHAAIAQVHLRTGQYTDAVDAAQRALALDPAHAQARYTLATALLRLGRTEEGQQELGAFQRVQAEAAAARARGLELGALKREASISAKSGDHVKAVALLRSALALEPDAVSHLNLGLALLDARQPAEAAEHFKAAIALNGPIEAHLHLADAYTALARTDEGRSEIEIYAQLRQERLRRAGADR